MPNIIGNWCNVWASNSTAEENSSDHGAIEATNDNPGKAEFGGNTAYHLSFDASRYNPIYGNSTTVQPPSYKVYAWKRIA